MFTAECPAPKAVTGIHWALHRDMLLGSPLETHVLHHEKLLATFSTLLNNVFINHQHITYGPACSKHVAMVKHVARSWSKVLQISLSRCPSSTGQVTSARDNADMYEDLICWGNGFDLIFFSPLL